MSVLAGSGVLAVLALVGPLGLGSAMAAPCAPSVQVSGDPALVATVGELLVRHGISNEGEGCPVVRVRLEHRGEEIVVFRLGEPTEERLVGEPATAATLIESWSRSDFEKPLLASLPPAARVADRAPPPPAPREPTAAGRAYAPPRGVQVFGVAETSLADDRTTWAGAVVGVCVQLGRACATARGRVAALLDGPGVWGTAERHTTDVLFGGDIPFGLGRSTLTLGFGAGMGAVHTGLRSASGGQEGSETFGLRADAHLAWTVSLAASLSLDLAASLDVSQVTDVESSSMSSLRDEPRLFARLGAGLRFGGR